MKLTVIVQLDDNEVGRDSIDIGPALRAWLQRSASHPQRDALQAIAINAATSSWRV